MAQQHHAPNSNSAATIELSQEESVHPVFRALLEADKPIRNFLIRLNRIFQENFNDTDLHTNSSCSGHVQSNGTIAYLPVIQTMFPDGDYPKREMFPHLCLDASCETTSPERRNQIQTFLSGIVERAINRTNRALGPDSAKVFIQADPEPEQIFTVDSFKQRDCYLFYYRFEVQSLRALEILQALWSNMEAELEPYDRSKSPTKSSAQDFFYNDFPLSHNQIRPT